MVSFAYKDGIIKINLVSLLDNLPVSLKLGWRSIIINPSSSTYFEPLKCVALYVQSRLLGEFDLFCSSLNLTKFGIK